MTADYIPLSDSGALAWMRAFHFGINNDPALYHITSSDAVSIGAAVTEFGDAMKVAVTPTTRTVPAVARKNTARDDATKICRYFAQRIKIDETISDGDKIAIGVRPMNRKKSRISVSDDQPALVPVSITQGIHTLHFRPLNQGGRAKPFGAVALQLFVYRGEGAPPNGYEDAKLCGTFTKTPAVILQDHENAGKTATYYGRWVSRRGETGVMSSPVSMLIAA